MTIVGFAFSKMLVNKNEGVKGKINISNNISITDVKESDLLLGTENEKGIKFSFAFSSNYEPKIGEIILEGHVLYMANSEKAKIHVAEWKKEKKIDKDVMKSILNSILTKCNIQALLLSKEINLPPPIPLPKVGEKR